MMLQPLIDTVTTALGMTALTATIGSALLPQEVDVRSGYSQRPLHSQELTAELTANTIHLFEDSEFQDDYVPMVDITTNKPGDVHQLADDIKDRMSSLRWNLPAGVVVVLLEDADGTGEQVVLWGKGQIDSLDPWDFGDKATAWSWYYIGGGDGDDEQVTAGMLPPPGAKPLTDAGAIQDSSIHLFKDKDFDGDFLPVNLLEHPATRLHQLTGSMSDSLTSLKWKLPEGVVVVLYQNEDGKGQQASIWGSGEISQVDTWDLNDKVSRWAWFYVGEKAPDRTDRSP